MSNNVLQNSYGSSSGISTSAPPAPRPMLDEFHESYLTLLNAFREKNQALAHIADRLVGAVPQAVPNKTNEDHPHPLIQRLMINHECFSAELQRMQVTMERLFSL